MVRSLRMVKGLILLLIVASGQLAAGPQNEAARDTAKVISDPASEAATYDSGKGPHRELRRLLDLYRDARSASMLEEADLLAKQIVELSIKSFGLANINTANALTNLAIVQTASEDYEAAILNCTSAIEIIERLDDRLSKDLIEPLKAMSAAQLQLGRADLARDSLYRAVHISQVNYGPHNFDQIEVLSELGRMFVMADLRDDAARLQKRMFYLQTRDVDPDSEEMLPPLYEQARWMRILGHINKERESYRDAIQIIERHRGRDDLALIEPLTNLGNSHLLVDSFDQSGNSAWIAAHGDNYLRRAVRIAFHNPVATVGIQYRTLIALGDYHSARSEFRRAKAVYNRASDLRPESTAGQQL